MKPEFDNGIGKLYHADARKIPLDDRSVHCVVTSPPYWGLRDYGLGEWIGGDDGCAHKQKMFYDVFTDLYRFKPFIVDCEFCSAKLKQAGIGNERTLSEHVENIVAVGREVHRVLRDDGTFWLNYGDAYAGSGRGSGSMKMGKINAGSKGTHGLSADRSGMLPAKNLYGLPWRIAFALQDDGWILRSAIVWHKPAPMPESVTDRPTSAYEMIFLFAKQGKYFYDGEPLRREWKGSDPGVPWEAIGASRSGKQQGDDPNAKNGISHKRGGGDHIARGANARNVWTINTQGRPDAHFATFPDELPRRCIVAGTSEHGVCADCGSQWEREFEQSAKIERVDPGHKYADGASENGKNGNSIRQAIVARRAAGLSDDSFGKRTIGWRATCDCEAGIVPATVLDPFVGSGTTVEVAQRLGRRGIGLDLNAEYLEIAKQRIGLVLL